MAEGMEWPRIDKIIPGIAQAAGHEKDLSRVYHPRVSNAGSCVRNLAMFAMGVEADPITGRQALIFDDGNLHEDASYRWLAQHPDVRLHSRQLPVNVTTIPGADPAKTRECDVCGQTIAGDVLHGHIDWITDFIETGTSFVTDHKSSGDFGFQKLDDETNEGYVQQVCGYISGLQQDEMDLRHGLILFKNKNNAQYRLVGIDYDAAEDTAQVVHLWNGKTFFLRDVVRRLIGLHARVEEARNTGVLPDRPYDFDDWHCEWCPRQNACWDTYPDEIAARAELKGALKDDDPLLEQLLRMRLLRDTSSDLDKEQKELRSMIVAEMEARDIKKGIGGGYRFTLTGTKRPSLDKSLIPEDILLAATRYSVSDTLRIDPIKKKGGTEG